MLIAWRGHGVTVLVMQVSVSAWRMLGLVWAELTRTYGWSFGQVSGWIVAMLRYSLRRAAAEQPNPAWRVQ